MWFKHGKLKKMWFYPHLHNFIPNNILLDEWLGLNIATFIYGYGTALHYSEVTGICLTMNVPVCKFCMHSWTAPRSISKAKHSTTIITGAYMSVNPIRIYATRVDKFAQVIAALQAIIQTRSRSLESWLLAWYEYCQLMFVVGLPQNWFAFQQLSNNQQQIDWSGCETNPYNLLHHVKKNWKRNGLTF